ncbi:unnamed protein product [Schistosoma guineensis]|uniref:18S rRNA (guanine-N(7))-methyltransferase n=4 Tax=Schistosoma TaxID=6181 RepID=A0A094ZHT8_SCHHA|nr:Williams Beuren syndrome chromosome region 22 protein [Schistosoma haematobium]RTG87769.1 18S rRNA (guanine1575-N7)-methyltransferase [Schistosoma bovis]CAH8531948.1 unnamed protein product [Schistosoma guineensis]CAH8536492.1 unnamed protein product [Schistosoma curassoni]KAH9587189.1 Williams Beuren syndrome chromosome region 22 protein [Schistosoma haematobium]CAH8534222.1 unnamed protein product [Schistosoma bovis]
MSHKRPEHSLPPELYYNSDEAKKYSSNSHIIDIQTRITERALELLALPEDEACMVLDIGCGSGLSGETITENGHHWVGVDISKDMLEVALDREVEGSLVLGDLGCGLPFRGGSFDGAISISAIQWLCNADRSSQNPIARLRRFFVSLYSSLTRGARAVLQFYPESIVQADLLQNEATRAGFTGGLVIDYPNSTRAKKYFLVLDVCSTRRIPQPLTENNEMSNHNRNKLETLRECRQMKKLPKHSVAWIKQKKQRARDQMKEVARDSKYTGRKRRAKF